MTLLPGFDTLDNRTHLLQFPDGRKELMFYLSGQVGSFCQDLLITFARRLGMPAGRIDESGGIDFAPPSMTGWEVRVTSAGQARILCPAPAQGPGKQGELFDGSSLKAIPGCLETARHNRYAILIAGPALPFAEGQGNTEVFKLIGDRPFAAGVVPVTFEQDVPAGIPLWSWNFDDAQTSGVFLPSFIIPDKRMIPLDPPPAAARSSAARLTQQGPRVQPRRTSRKDRR